MSVTAGVGDTVIAVQDKLRGKIGQTKVKRHWPGKAPKWAGEVDEDGEIKTSLSAVLEKAFPPRNDFEVVSKDDPRLRRVAESRIDNRDRRRIRPSEIVSPVEEEAPRQEGLEAEEIDEDALEEKRRRNKERLLQREQEEAELLPLEDEEEEEEGSSEDETDSEAELGGRAMVKPAFVPETYRDTIVEREHIEAEDLALEELKKKRLAERKKETKQMLVEEIRKDEEIQKRIEQDASIADIELDDEINEAEEYEAWKVREIARIKRDREEREAMVKERREVERLRNMTEEERREWERRNPKAAPKQKQKWRFRQKYYHKGAFFQTGDDSMTDRDFSAPTGEDRMVKTKLRKVMLVKNFGRSGRTKWTHLVNEDTTDWSNPWTYNDPLWAEYYAKMAGMNAPLARPKGSKKLKDWESR